VVFKLVRVMSGVCIVAAAVTEQVTGFLIGATVYAKPKILQDSGHVKNERNAPDQDLFSEGDSAAQTQNRGSARLGKHCSLTTSTGSILISSTQNESKAASWKGAWLILGLEVKLKIKQELETTAVRLPAGHTTKHGKNRTEKSGLVPHYRELLTSNVWMLSKERTLNRNGIFASLKQYRKAQKKARNSIFGDLGCTRLAQDALNTKA